MSKKQIASVHEEKRPLKCLKCDLSFSTEESKQKHEKSIHKEKENNTFCIYNKFVVSGHEGKDFYKCIICKETFRPKNC